MKVKFIEVGAMGNQVFLVGDIAEVSDQTGQELIDKGYAEKVADSAKVTEPPKPAQAARTTKTTSTKAEDDKA
jgi:hypothetical protein